MNSAHVVKSPLSANGASFSPPAAVMPFGQMMQGLSTSGAKVEEVVVVATVVSSSTTVGVGAGIGIDAVEQQ